MTAKTHAECVADILAVLPAGAVSPVKLRRIVADTLGYLDRDVVEAVLDCIHQRDAVVAKAR